MRETIFKSVAALAAIAGIGFVVWYAMQDPKARRDPAAVTQNLTDSMNLLEEGLTLIEKKGAFTAGADRLKEAVFQFSKSISELRQLRPAARENAAELVRAKLVDLDGQFTRIAWTPEVGLAILQTMNQVYTVVGRGLDLPPPALSHLSGEMVVAIHSLTETLEGVQDAATAEAAVKTVQETGARLDAAKEAKDRLTAEGRATLQSLSRPVLEKLKALAAKTLAKPGVADKLQGPLDRVLDELNGLAA